ncbi:MAG: hypothetical protein ACRCSR_02660, partial [Bacteroidales bacterium]
MRKYEPRRFVNHKKNPYLEDLLFNNPRIKPNPNEDLLFNNPREKPNSNDDLEQVLNSRLNLPDSLSPHDIFTRQQILDIGREYATQLSGDVVGGGITGFNLGGANSPESAVANPIHDPFATVIHELGPFGSKSALSKNIINSEDPTVKQRSLESIDTVHDDTLKANLAKKQRLEDVIRRNTERALTDMKDMIKSNASAAALKDQQVAQMNAQVLVEKSEGKLDAIAPGTNKTYKQLIEQQLELAEHAGSHARNPDLYELEAAAEKTGNPRPTIGKEIIDQALREEINKNLNFTKVLKTEEIKREEEMREKTIAIALQLQEEKTRIDAEKIEAVRRAKIEEQAVEIADANANYKQAKIQEVDNKLRDSELIAAKGLTVVQAKKESQDLKDAESAANKRNEAVIVRNSDKNSSLNSALTNEMKQAVGKQEDLTAKLGESDAAAKRLQSANNQLIANVMSNTGINMQKSGEALAASIDGSILASSMNATKDEVASTGEKALGQNAIARGIELSQAAQGEKEIAKETRARGGDLNSAKEKEKSLAKSSRSTPVKSEYEENPSLAFNEATKFNTAVIYKKEPKYDGRAGSFKGYPEAGADSRDNNAFKPKKANKEDEKAQSVADAMGIIGTIPDDTDTIDLKNSTLEFPVKTFIPVKAQNNAEAGALAAQEKIKDNIRGKITDKKIDSPLNVLKGSDGYMNVPENAKNINVDEGKVYFTEAAVSAMEKAGDDMSKLEHHINTGERTNMGIGLGYYVADASGMSFDMPSPSNPNPPALLSGKKGVIDVSHADVMDIRKGELKLDKWENYSTKIRPKINQNKQAILHENISECILTDDCVRQALNEADAIYNTKSEIITNPDGTSYIKVTPLFGVSEQITYDEAVFNLDKIKKTCIASQGQMGISQMQEKETNVEDASYENKSFNVGQKSMEEIATKETVFAENVLKEASANAKTHKVVAMENAFDKHAYSSKKAIIAQGSEAIVKKDGKEAAENVLNDEIKTELAKESKEMKKEYSDGVKKGEIVESKQDEAGLKTASRIKEEMLKNSLEMSSKLHILEEEYLMLMKKVSMSTISSMYSFFRNSTNDEFRTKFEESMVELRTIFGANAESFEKFMFQTISNITGYPDPNEKVLICKKTTYVPKLVKIYHYNGKNSEVMVKEHKQVPVTRIIQIPIQNIFKSDK